MLLSENARKMRAEFAANWMRREDMLEDELAQAYDEGRALPGDAAERVRAIQLIESAEERRLAGVQFLDDMQRLPYRADYPYLEPSCWPDIMAQCPGMGGPLPEYSAAQRFDRVYGALLGRCAGCLLGAPVEGWTANEIQDFMHVVDNDPIRGYFRSDIDPVIRARFGVRDDVYRYQRPINIWANNANGCMPEDDDIDYLLLNLLLLEEIGRDFTTEDCANNWLYHFPMCHTALSERITYQNLAMGVAPDASGRYRHPHRETLGAQIRADVFGYACPGDPMLSASMAYRDARMSSDKNGLYGAMMVAAMLSAAACVSSAMDIIRTGLSFVPIKSRLAEGVGMVVRWFEDKCPVRETMRRVASHFANTAMGKTPYAMCHAVPNTMIVAAALLYADNDLERGIGAAVSASFDTDCNAATVGSIIGMVKGASALPARWIAPFGGKAQTCVSGYDDVVSLDQIAGRIVAL